MVTRSNKMHYNANMSVFWGGFDGISTYPQLFTKKEKEPKRKKGLLRPFKRDFLLDFIRSLI